MHLDPEWFLVAAVVVVGIVWLAGVAFASTFGHLVTIVSSLALMGFGVWVALGAWRELASRKHAYGHHPHQHEHEHEHQKSSRTALLLIVGSSPMVEGIPAFFAAGKYGAGLIAIMAVLFAISTMATYVVLCVTSAAGLQHMRLGSFERYGEVASGAFIAVVGFVFLFVPGL